MYDLLAERYEEIFPVSSEQIEFTARRVKPQDGSRARLLDVGCATGTLAAALAERGIETDAADLNEAMIRRARELHRRDGLRFHAMDMRETGKRFEPGSFDAVSCMGNTLVHLSGPAEIREFLRDTGAVLRQGGVLILQILNYGYILELRIERLPDIVTEHVRFTRRYEYPDSGQRIDFVTSMYDREKDEERSDSVRLYPLEKVELEGLLEEAGYCRPRYYGSFTEKPLESDDFPLIAVAEKA